MLPIHAYHTSQFRDINYIAMQHASNLQAIAALISWPKERCKRAKTNFPPRILVLCVPKVESLTLSISLSRTLFSTQKLGAIPPLTEEKSTHARDSLLWQRAIDTQTQAP
jgi:hypothetical protein